MLTPLEILIDPISLVILAIYGGLMIWEAVVPGRKLPKMRFWRLRGLAVFAVYFYLASYLPMLIDQYLVKLQVFNLEMLGVAGGSILGVLLYECGVYFWHRALHRSNFLWKGFHQMHHSAERIDTYSAFFFSPLDMIGWTVLGSLTLTLLVGLDPRAATITIVATNFLGMFQHTNIKTPVWLGYIVQRPESHTIHHARGIHAYNYSDLPIFDILFGTFRNPKTYDHETGFYIGASTRIKDMLLFKEVDQPEERKIA